MPLGPTRLARRLHTAASILLLLFGLAHLAAFFRGAASPPANPEAAKVIDAMKSYREDLPGASRSLYEIFEGFSITVALFGLALGGVNLAAIRSAGGAAARPITIVTLGALAILCGVSITYWFLIPTAFLTAAFVLYVSALSGLK